MNDPDVDLDGNLSQALEFLGSAGWELTHAVGNPALSDGLMIFNRLQTAETPDKRNVVYR